MPPVHSGPIRPKVLRMDAEAFDRLAKRASGKSRRDVLRMLIGTAAALVPLRAQAQPGVVVVLGGVCMTNEECQQGSPDVCPETDVVCADNGFTADGLHTCCTDGCCQSDADCCGDMRCAPVYEFGPRCRFPPFPTRSAGQVCASNSDCFHWPGCFAECIGQRCQCREPYRPIPEPPEISLIPDTEAAMVAAESVAAQEVSGSPYYLYRSMHPDAQAIIPEEAVIGWYENEFARFGEPSPKAVKVRFVSWTWDVTGRTYPNTAEVALRQQFPDGTVVRDEVRLVKDRFGNWGWFFGRTRAFVEEQIARFPERPEGDFGARPGEPCESTQDCSQLHGPARCDMSVRDGITQLMCLRDSGGECQSTEDCHQVGGPARCMRSLRHGIMQNVCLREEGGACDADHECMPPMVCSDRTCGSAP